MDSDERVSTPSPSPASPPPITAARPRREEGDEHPKRRCPHHRWPEEEEAAEEEVAEEAAVAVAVAADERGCSQRRARGASLLRAPQPFGPSAASFSIQVLPGSPLRAPEP